MASKSGAIRAGRAFVEIFADDGPMQRALRASQARLRRWATQMQSMARISSDISRGGDALIGGGLAIAAPIVAGLKSITHWASKAEESTNRFNQVFGTDAAAAGQFADQLADQVGRAGIELRDNLAMFQSFNVGMGFDQKVARQMSEALVGLGLDLASFNNLSDEDAMGRILAAMSGSGEVLDRFGINIKEVALQQEALNKGLDPKNMTEQQKAMMRMSIIARTLGEQGAVGDAARTASSYANVLKRVRASLIDLAVSTGQTLLPPLARFFGLVSSALGVVVNWVKSNAGLVKSVATIAAGVVIAGGAMIALGLAVKVVAATVYTFHLLLMPLSIALKLVSMALGLVAGALGLITSPAALAVAAVAALAGAAIYASGALEPLKRAWGEVGQIIDKTIGVIRDRIMAGDLAGAAKVAWAGLQAVWQVGIAALKESWTRFRGWYVQNFLEGFDTVAGIAIDAVATIRSAWAGLRGWFAGFWADTKNAAGETWNLVRLQATKAANATRAAMDPEFDRDAADRKADKDFLDAQFAAQRALHNEERAAAEQTARDRADAEADRQRWQAELDAWIASANAQASALIAEAQAAGTEAAAQAASELEATLARIKQGDLLKSVDAALDDFFAPVEQVAAETPDFQATIEAALAAAQSGTSGAASAAATPGGGFDARALAIGLSGRDRDLQQTAENTRETATQMRRLVDRGGRLVFTT